MRLLNEFYLPKDIKKFHLADKFASKEEIRIHFICWNTFWQAYISHFKVMQDWNFGEFDS